MDKYRITLGLELSLALVASQGIMHLMDHRLCQWEKQLIKREIGAEMVCVYRTFNIQKSKNIQGDLYRMPRSLRHIIL